MACDWGFIKKPVVNIEFCLKKYCVRDCLRIAQEIVADRRAKILDVANVKGINEYGETAESYRVIFKEKNKYSYEDGERDGYEVKKVKGMNRYESIRMEGILICVFAGVSDMGGMIINDDVFTGKKKVEEIADDDFYRSGQRVGGGSIRRTERGLQVSAEDVD